jgi:hypothetical protein
MNGVYTDFDLAVEIGGPGIGGDDIQSTTFTVANAGISASQFIVSGARLTSVWDGRRREESVKLIDYTPRPDNPIPEPATFGLMGVACAGLFAARRLRS